MKKTISDLLDAYSQADPELENTMPLSSERIKALTMNKIERTSGKPMRAVSRALIAAAVVAALILSVFAVEIVTDGGWFRGFFEQNSKVELSPAQISFIEENAILIDKRETLDSYTLHLESVLNDDKMVYVKLNLYAPEGVVIPYEEAYGFDGAYVLADGAEKPWEYWGYSTLDEDASDNHIGIVMVLRFAEDMDTGFLTAGNGVTLALTGLTKSYGTFFDRRTEQLSEGTWAFDLDFAAAQEDGRELIGEPVTCMMVKDMTGEETQISLTSVCLRTLGVDMVYDYPSGGDLERLDWLGVKLVRKDGSAERLMPSDGSVKPDGEQITGYISFIADTPIIPEEVAAIELPDGTRIPVNTAD